MVSMARQKSGTSVWRIARWRPWVQASLLLAWLDPFLLRMHSVCGPVFHCYSCPLATFACPIGVLANFSALHVIPFIAIGTLLAVGAVFGSFVCGWACPFGFLQDLVARIPTPKLRLPGFLGCFRYAVLLGLVLAIPYLYGEGHALFFCRLCPAGALEGAVPFVASQAIAGKAIIWPSTAKTVILAVFVVAMFFTYRPWCTLFCPLGAIFTLCNRVSFFFVRFRADRCSDCDLCRDLCRHRGPQQQRAGDLRCIRCLDCARCRALSVGTVFGSTQVVPEEPGASPVVTLQPAASEKSPLPPGEG
jgi:ferredoxin-type protein NapH